MQVPAITSCTEVMRAACRYRWCPTTTTAPSFVQVEGLWHSALVVGEEEFSYGPPFRRYPAGTSHMGPPAKTLDLG
jgi:hypothetical protein